VSTVYIVHLYIKYYDNSTISTRNDGCVGSNIGIGCWSIIQGLTVVYRQAEHTRVAQILLYGYCMATPMAICLK